MAGSACAVGLFSSTADCSLPSASFNDRPSNAMSDMTVSSVTWFDGRELGDAAEKRGLNSPNRRGRFVADISGDCQTHGSDEYDDTRRRQAQCEAKGMADRRERALSVVKDGVEGEVRSPVRESAEIAQEGGQGTGSVGGR
jgi:hypothetical protein